MVSRPAQHPASIYSIKCVNDRDALQSFSMEASVCLPCDVPPKWSGLEPWQ
jgi:hypothetical protein